MRKGSAMIQRFNISPHQKGRIPSVGSFPLAVPGTRGSHGFPAEFYFPAEFWCPWGYFWDLLAAGSPLRWNPKPRRRRMIPRRIHWSMSPPSSNPRPAIGPRLTPTTPCSSTWTAAPRTSIRSSCPPCMSSSSPICCSIRPSRSTARWNGRSIPIGWNRSRNPKTTSLSPSNSSRASIGTTGRRSPPMTSSIPGKPSSTTASPVPPSRPAPRKSSTAWPSTTSPSNT